jgi:hypothetical protein
MKFYRKIRKYLVSLVAINLVLAGLLQEVHAGATASANSPKQCVQRDGLTFNGVGMWTRLPMVLKLYGQPLRIEPLEGVNSERVFGYYYYKDIKLFIFNSIVWHVNVLTPDISSKSGIRLLSDFSEVEKKLDVKLKNPYSGQSSRDKYKVPICPTDPPEVEEYVLLSFDQNKRLVKFTVLGVLP